MVACNTATARRATSAAARDSSLASTDAVSSTWATTSRRSVKRSLATAVPRRNAGVSAGATQ